MNEIEKLDLLYGRTKPSARAAIKKAVDLFGLEFTDENTGEHLNKQDFLNHLLNEDSKIKNMKKAEIKEVAQPEEKKGRKEIEATPNFEMVKFENAGDRFIGWLKDSTEIDFKGTTGKKKVFIVVDIDDKVEKTLPTNISLSNKVSAIESAKGFGSPIDIEFTGYEQTANGRMKVFKVFDEFEEGQKGADDLPF